VHDALTNGQSVELIHLFAMSAAFDVVLQSYIPPVASVGFLASPYTCLIRGRGIIRTCAPEFTLMWTTASNKPDAIFDPNHIVLLSPRSPEEVALDSSEVDEPLQEDDRTCDYTNLDAEATPLEDVDDFVDTVSGSDTESELSNLEAPTGDTVAEERADGESDLLPLPGCDFLPTSTVMAILQNATNGIVIATQ